MNKEEMTEALERAKRVHMHQMQKISSLLKGEVVENPTPVNKTECEYGKWFYGNKEQLVYILGIQLYERIDVLHEQWHYGYLRIHDLFFKESKKGLFTKLLKPSKVSGLDIDKGKLYYVELQEVTKALLNTTDAAIRRVSALNESKFKN